MDSSKGYLPGITKNYSRPGQNTSQLSQSKMRKDLDKKVKYYSLPRSHKIISPHVKRQIDIEKRRQETELGTLVKARGFRLFCKRFPSGMYFKTMK